MLVGAFDLDSPLPELKQPDAFAILSPWIDVGHVGTLSLPLLENYFGARRLGKLKRPELFYDFTRYRPTVRRVKDHRDIIVPNTHVSYAQREDANDLLFLHCLEPHMLGETYADSVVKVLKRLKARSYCLIGAMYDSVPHTRPLRISGTASDRATDERLRQLKVSRSSYQGPTTINVLTSEQAVEQDIDSLTLIIHLPHYTQLEEDYSAQYALLNVICNLYKFSMDLSKIKRRGEEQYKRISLAIEMNPQVKEIVEAMEKDYDARPAEEQKPPAALSPEVERFLKEMDKKFGSDQQG